MAQKELVKKVLFWIVLVFNIIAALLLLMSWMAGFVHPSISRLVVFCGLGFPYLLFINIGFVLVWLFLDYRLCLLSIALILLNINTIDKHFQFRGADVPENCPNAIKVLSYNTNLFGLYQDSDMGRRRADLQEIIGYLQGVNPDIACFQEFFWDKSETLNFHTRDQVAALMNVEETPQHCYLYFTDTSQSKYFFGVAIYSKYKIVNAGPVLDDQSSNAIIYADIKFREDTVRVYNAHLSSIHMSATDYAISRQLTTNAGQDPTFEKNAKKLYRKVADAAATRQMQADSLRSHIELCPYPVIVCGDFNDTPAGYCYNTVARQLDDSVRKSGKGRGMTYHGGSMPNYRIDYILHSPCYLSYGYTVGKEMGISDHYPVTTTISLLKKK